MTEFEQQVADALRTITFSAGTAGMVALPMDDEHINRIAPRVAAAITGAIDFFEVGDPRPFVFGGAVAEQAQVAALAALRGES